MILPEKERLYITGQKKLSGSVDISGSKNAALPILAASLAINGTSIIHNVPDISDTRGFISIMESLGVKVERKGSSLTVHAQTLKGNGEIHDPYICKMRASILFLAPLLVRFGRVKTPFPGGCVLGKRSVDTHLDIFTTMGAKIQESTTHLELTLPEKKLKGATVVLPELSVTATENALIAMSFASGPSELRLAASEPHVQNLCEFLESAQVEIIGKGGHVLHVQGRDINTSATVRVTSDYLQVGTYLLAGILTDSEITIRNTEPAHLDSFLERLAHTNAEFIVDEDQKTITTQSRKKDLCATNIQTGVFPKFPTDLHPQFAVLLSQCHGRSKIFETLFERKFAYLLELEKMGAQVEIQNPHVFHISGPKTLQGVPVASQDIRAGAAMILAGLIARGETEISNIHYIHRGYEKIEQKLSSLGASVSIR